MLGRFIEWSEADPARGRKVVLFSTVFVFLLVTIALFAAAMWGLKMSAVVTSLYMTFVGLMAAIYGFYTGTSSDKAAKLADKASDIMLKKLDKIAKSAK